MLDITDETGIAALVQRIVNDPERRPLRALVNNAGMSFRAELIMIGISARVNMRSASVV
jgi:NAD(P)-dependent dehydrogenase (short-subunit alcohol dehydrogenase family)